MIGHSHVMVARSLRSLLQDWITYTSVHRKDKSVHADLDLLTLYQWITDYSKNRRWDTWSIPLGLGKINIVHEALSLELSHVRELPASLKHGYA